MNGLVENNAGGRKILVAAIGNPDRGDDGAGLLVAARLKGRLPPDVALLTRRGDILALLDEWAGFDAVICIDAAALTGEIGGIHRIEANAGALPVDLSFPSTHSFGLAEAMALGRALHMLPATMIIYAIEGAVFDAGAPMTPAVAAAAAEAADRIIAEIAMLQSNNEERMAHA